MTLWSQREVKDVGRPTYLSGDLIGLSHQGQTGSPSSERKSYVMTSLSSPIMVVDVSSVLSETRSGMDFGDSLFYAAWNNVTVCTSFIYQTLKATDVITVSENSLYDYYSNVKAEEY